MEVYRVNKYNLDFDFDMDDSCTMIDRVVVKNLFDLFDYDISFKNEHNVSILIAPNGCGKTTIFNIIDFLTNPTAYNFIKIKKIPFKRFECYFSNGAKVSLYENDTAVNEYPEYNKTYELEYKNTQKSVNIYKEFLEISENCGQKDSFEIDRKITSIIENIKGVYYSNVHFITTDRLFLDTYNQGYKELGILGFETDVDKETGKYRVFSNNSTLKYSIENIIKEVKSMMGTLCSMEYDVDSQETVQRYIEKAKLFKKIFDERNSITKKTIELDMGEGFEILKETKDTPLYSLSKEKKDIMDKYNGFKILQNGKEIPIQCLSSGETHDFIMFYELIFQPMECEVLMIDEPEVSLHIQWQKTFVDYILEICKVNKLQVLIATHSPSIINGHTELYANKEMVQL